MKHRTLTEDTADGSVDEGSSVTFTITADEAVDGDTDVDYTLGGDINADDIDRDSLTGTATIADGETSTDVTVDVVADNTTEDAEDLTLSLDGTDVSSTVTVNDTSTDAIKLTESEDNLVGTDGNDLFSASVKSTSVGNQETLQDFDSLDGGGGDADRLEATLANNVDIEPTLESIEEISVRAADSDAGAETLDLNSAEDAELVENRGSTAGLNYTNIQGLATVGMDSVRDGNDFTVQFADSVVTDANNNSDTQDITLDDVRAADETNPQTNLTIDNQGDDDSLDNAAITTEGAASFLRDMETHGSIMDLTVDGSADLAVLDRSGDATFDADATSINASGLDANLTLVVDSVTGAVGNQSFTYTGAQQDDDVTFPALDFDSGDTDITINTGEGDDQVDLQGALNAVDPTGSFSIDGGAGSNTLVVTDGGGDNDPLETNGDIASGDITNFQTVSADMSNDSGNELDATLVGGVQNVVLSDVGNNNTTTLTVPDCSRPDPADALPAPEAS